MVENLNGRLVFTYNCPKKEYSKPIRLNFKLSLLGALMGIFLLPNLAYLSTIAPERLIELTNQERQAAGLKSLTTNQLLTQAATLKAKAILETNTFKHTINDRKFSAWIRDTGYDYSYVGENLAIDFVTSEGVVEAWNGSPLHKKNLLNPYYREIGIAALDGKFQGQDTTVVVQIFGAPAVGSATPLLGNLEPNYLNSSLLPEEINLFNPRLINAENLLTNAIINRELAPLANNNLVLPADGYTANQVNTFIAQPNYRLNINNFLTLFSALLAAGLLIMSYSYNFLKINKLGPAQF